MKPSHYLATQPTFSWTNLSSATASTISHKFWQSAQAWAQPLVTWVTPQTDDSAFLLQLQQEESYQRHLDWRREVNQQLRSCFMEIVSLYRQGALVAPDQLGEVLKAQQASFDPKIVSPWLYDRYVKRWAQRLPRYAHTFEGAAAQFREHLKTQPEEALGYFYHEIINHLINRSGESILPEFTRSTTLGRAPLMAYYQGLVPNELWQAVNVLLKTTFGPVDSSTLIAVSGQRYQQALAKLNALFLPLLVPTESTDQLASTSPTSLLARFDRALTAGWQYGQSHPKTALWGAAATALGVSAAYLGSQPNSTRTSLSWLDTLQPMDAWLPYVSSIAPLSLAMSVVSLSYAQQHPGLASWKTTIPLMLGLSIPLSPVMAQPQPDRWVKTLGGIGGDYGNSVQQTTDGGYIITGYTTNFGAGNFDLLLSKWTESGDLSWSRRSGVTGDDRGYSVQQTTDGGYIVTGITDSFGGSGDFDLWLSKWTASGEVSWSRTLGGIENDFGYSVQQTTDGGYIVTGNYGYIVTGDYGIGLLSSDLWLSKWTASGEVSWTRTLGGTGFDEAYSVQQTSDGGYIVIGITNSFGAGNFDLWLSKWTASGDLSWARTLGGTGYDIGHSVQQTTDGGYIVIGSTQSFGAGNFDLWLSKWTASGDLSWARTLGGTGYDIGHSVQQTTDGGYIVIGSTDSFGAGRADLWLSKWTASGEVSWTRTLGGIEYDEGDSVQQTTDGGYIVAGDTYSFGAGSVDLWLSKWNSLGETASNQCVSSPNVTSVATVVSAQTPNVTLGTPSVSAQDLVVSAQVANPAVSTTCNEPPVLSTSSNNFTYMEKDPATVIGYNLTVSDADNPTLVHAQVSISSGFVSIEDVLGFSDQNGIVGNYQAETGVLTLTGASSVANYETALRSVTYLNPSNNPSTGIRTFEFIANDGQLDSNTVAVRATVVAINDAPSTSESPNLTVLLAAIAAGTGSLLLCLGAVSYCVWRKRQRGPVNALARELEMVYPEPTPSLDRGVELVSPDRLEKGYTIISDRFALINKITPEKAQLLQQQTGIEVTFTEGKHKQKFALGQGQFGKLRLAQDMETREFVGVKKIKGEAQIAASEEEAGLLAHVSGLAHVIQLKASVRTLGSDRQAVQYQFLELAGFGSGETLQRCLAQLQDPALKRKLLVHIARGLLTGFSQLHEQKATVHLDMKPANFVLTQAGEVKVIDFGCARLLPEGTALMRGGNGDMGYFSPDRIAHCRFLVGQHPGETLSHFDGKQADSWALGVTLFELATNRKLFPLIGATQIMASRDTAYVIEQLALVSELYRPAADSFWAVVKGLLDPHPKTRLTPQTALAHPIFQDPAYRFTAAAQEAVFRKLKALDCLYGSDQAPVQASPALPKDQVYAAPYLAQQGGGSASVRFPSGRSSVSSRPSFFQPVSGQRRIDVYANRPEARDEYANRPEVRDEYANAWR